MQLLVLISRVLLLLVSVHGELVRRPLVDLDRIGEVSNVQLKML